MDKLSDILNKLIKGIEEIIKSRHVRGAIRQKEKEHKIYGITAEEKKIIEESLR